MKKLNVLHILWTGKTGGAEIFVRSILEYSNQDKFQHAVCFLAAGGPLAKQMQALGVPVHYLGMQTGLSLGKTWPFYKLLKNFQPQIIHFHTRNYMTNIISLLFPGMKRVYSEHGGSFDPLLAKSIIKSYQKFYKIFLRFYSIVYTNAEYLRQQIIDASGLKPDRVKIYYYGIKPDRYGNKTKRQQHQKEWDVPKGHKVVGVAGRLVEQKGIDDFIKIAAEMNHINKHYFFVIVGSGQQREELEDLARSLKLQVLFLGDRQDLPDVLSAFDIYIFTSRWEPFGIVVLEALASGIPVVGFAIPGNRAIIEQGGGGVLIEGRDHKRVAMAAIDILTSKEEYTKHVEQGLQNIMNNFDVQRNIHKLEEDYLSIL